MADSAIRTEALRLIAEAQTWGMGTAIKGPPAVAMAILDLADAVRSLAAAKGTVNGPAGCFNLATKAYLSTHLAAAAWTPAQDSCSLFLPWPPSPAAPPAPAAPRR